MNRPGLIVVGEINLGGSIEPIHDPVTLVQIAVGNGASAILMSVTCCKPLIDLSDDMTTWVEVQFFPDPQDVLLKAVVE